MKKNKTKKNYYCKLDVSLIKSIVYLFQKCKRKFGPNFWNQVVDRPGIENEVIVMISADSANYIVKGGSNIVLLNIQIINLFLLK